MVRSQVSYPLNWSYGVSLEHLKRDIAALEKLGAEDVQIEIVSGSWDNDKYLSIAAYQKRLETDAEYDARLLKEEERLKAQKERDLRELERLENLYKTANKE